MAERPQRQRHALQIVPQAAGEVDLGDISGCDERNAQRFASLQSRCHSGSVIIFPGEVPERPNGAVSKTVVVLWATVGSNPTLSATQPKKQRKRKRERKRTAEGCVLSSRLLL